MTRVVNNQTPNPLAYNDGVYHAGFPAAEAAASTSHAGPVYGAPIGLPTIDLRGAHGGWLAQTEP